MARKLGRPTDQRMAMLKSQVTDLLWYGKIETTVTRGKDVQRMAEKVLSLAINSYEDTVKVQKTRKNSKGEVETFDCLNDGSKKLAARRRIMASVYDIKEKKLELKDAFYYFTSPVTCAKASEDDKRIIACGKDRTAQIWKTDSHEAIDYTLSGHRNVISCTDFIGDSMVVTGSYDNSVRFWRL